MSTLSSLITDVKKTFSRTNPDLVFDPMKKVSFTPSGSIVFDLVSGGGLPKGRITEIFGMEGSAKSSLLYGALAGVQKRGGVGILIDAENAWDPVFARNTFGLEHDGVGFAVFQPDNIEEIDALLEKISDLTKLDLIGFDSVDAMKPKGQVECSLADERRVGAHAQAMSRFVAKIRIFAKEKNIPVVFINQMRTNIQTGRSVDQNVGTGAGFNVMEQYTVTGGMALRYYASLRMKLEYGGRIEDEMGINPITGSQDKIRIGNEIKVINVKNKVGTPFLKSNASFLFPMPGQKGGWSNDRDLLELLKKRGKIRQVSTKFVYNGLHIQEWSNIGSKKASEQLFLSTPELKADAAALLDSLIQADRSVQNSGQIKMLEVATQQDLAPEDTFGQDDKTIALSSVLGEDVPNQEGISQDRPLDNIGLAEPIIAIPSDEITL